MIDYLVVGICVEDSGRFAGTFTAYTPEEAEAICARCHPDLLIAGVIALVDGKMEVVA